MVVSLVAPVWLVFGQTLHHAFVDYDDNIYVYQNSIVSSGVTLRGLVWAFTHSHASNWHPLTTISHMFDCQLYRLKPRGHHFTNIVLHAIAASLLFLVLQQMTGTLWRSAFVAAVFAIHPLQVESVAWIAPNALQDPTLELHDGNGALMASNDNWRSDQEAEIIATGIPPTNDLESAILPTLPPGVYNRGRPRRE